MERGRFGVFWGERENEGVCPSSSAVNLICQWSIRSLRWSTNSCRDFSHARISPSVRMTNVSSTKTFFPQGRNPNTLILSILHKHCFSFLEKTPKKPNNHLICVIEIRCAVEQHDRVPVNKSKRLVCKVLFVCFVWFFALACTLRVVEARRNWYRKKFLEQINEGESNPTCGIAEWENDEISKRAGLRFPAARRLDKLIGVGVED